MKVMFVIQGEGRGHLTQALALKEMLQHSGHEVVDVMVGKSKNREIPGFFQEKIGLPITLFNSPNFIPSKENCKFSLCKSVAYNVLLSPSYLKSLFLIRHHIKESGAEMVIMRMTRCSISRWFHLFFVKVQRRLSVTMETISWDTYSMQVFIRM